MIEVIARRHNLYGGCAVLFLREIDDRSLIEQLAVDISKKYDDRCRRTSKLAFLYDSKAKGGLKYSALRIECDIVEEDLKKIRVELSLVNVVHDIVGDVRHVRLLVRTFARERVVDICNRCDLGVAVHFLSLDATGIA